MELRTEGSVDLRVSSVECRGEWRVRGKPSPGGEGDKFKPALDPDMTLHLLLFFHGARYIHVVLQRESAGYPLADLVESGVISENVDQVLGRVKHQTTQP